MPNGFIGRKITKRIKRRGNNKKKFDKLRRKHLEVASPFFLSSFF